MLGVLPLASSLRLPSRHAAGGTRNDVAEQACGMGSARDHESGNGLGRTVCGWHRIAAWWGLAARDVDRQIVPIVFGTVGNPDVLMARDVDLVPQSDHFGLVEDHAGGLAEVARLFGVDQRLRYGLPDTGLEVAPTAESLAAGIEGGRDARIVGFHPATARFREGVVQPLEIVCLQGLDR